MMISSLDDSQKSEAVILTVTVYYSKGKQIELAKGKCVRGKVQEK